jgi:hypothetical protein
MGQSGDDVMEAVRVGIANLTSPWTLEELGACVGADPQSLVPYLDRLLEGGTIVPLGPDPRVDDDEAPMLYGPPPFNDSPN